MNKKTDPKSLGRDSELEKLLEAYRSVEPTTAEMDGWKRAIRAENASFSPAPSRNSNSSARAPTNIFRLIVRTAIQVGVAASLGFLVGAIYMEKRTNEGGALLFSQMEPSSSSAFAKDADESREVVRINLDRE